MTTGPTIINAGARTVTVRTTNDNVGNSLDTGGWARLDITATTPANSTVDWQFDTYTNTAGTQSNQNDTPTVLVETVLSRPTVTSSFVTSSAATATPTVPIITPGVSTTLNFPITQLTGGVNDIKYTSIALPACFTDTSVVSITVRTVTGVSQGTGGYSSSVLDGFIRLPGGNVPLNGSLNVEFTTTPNCAEQTFTVPSSPSSNNINPASGTNQIDAVFPGPHASVQVATANLSLTKSDSADPVPTSGSFTYSLSVANAGPAAATGISVSDPLPAGTTFVSFVGTDPTWSCGHVSGTVTCTRATALPPGATAPDIKINVTAPGAEGTISNTATVTSPKTTRPPTTRTPRRRPSESQTCL